MRVVEGVSYSRTQDRGKGDSSHEILPKSTAAGREEEKREWEEARPGEAEGGNSVQASLLHNTKRECLSR